MAELSGTGKYFLGANNYLGGFSDSDSFSNYFNTAAEEAYSGWNYGLDLQSNSAGFLDDNSDDTALRGEIPWKTIILFTDMGRAGKWDLRLSQSYNNQSVIYYDWNDNMVTETLYVPNRNYTIESVTIYVRYKGSHSYGKRSFESKFWASVLDTNGTVNKIFVIEDNHSTSYQTKNATGSITKTSCTAGEIPLSEIYYASAGASISNNRYLYCSELFVKVTYSSYALSIYVYTSEGISKIGTCGACRLDNTIGAESLYCTVDELISSNNIFITNVDENYTFYIKAFVEDDYVFYGWYDVDTGEKLTDEAEVQYSYRWRTTDVKLRAVAKKVNVYSGVQRCNNIYVGDQEVKQIYIGDKKVFGI